MSKLDIHIEFDRPDRTYRGGEEVTGSVTIRAQKDVRCRSLRLEYRWQTHGRGNTDTGGQKQIQIAEGTFPAGHHQTFPFRFPAPTGPLTYRGDYLNIDHYVRVRADVRWAFDPKAEEEFIVVAGTPDSGEHVPVVRDGDVSSRAGLSGQLRKVGIGGGIGLIVLGCLCFFPFGLVLIPLGAVCLAMGLRNILAEKKLGQVQLVWGDRRASPGGKLPLSIRFTPHKSVHVNEITAKLTSKEICTSGSGTNSTTYRNTLIEQDWRLAGTQQFQPHQNVRVDYAIAIPDIAAYSFLAPSNRLSWEVAVRVDIPNWPDWNKMTMIVVVPGIDAPGTTEREKNTAIIDAELVGTPVLAAIIDAELVGTPVPATIATAAAAAFPSPAGLTPAGGIAGSPDNQPLEPAAAPAPELTSEFEAEAGPVAAAETPGADGKPMPTPVADPVEQPQTDQQPVAETPPAEPPGPSLKKLFSQLLAANKFGDDRDDIVREHDETVFRCSITVQSVTRSYGYDVGQEYRGGRTLTGTLTGTDYTVFVIFRTELNEKLDALESGERIEVQSMLLGWDRLYDRLKLREVA